MKISYNWLNDYLQSDMTVDEMSVVLTDIGLEVDGIDKIESGRGLDGVVVGEVLACSKHPDADRLSITQVNIGGQTLQIVCGAPNVAAGQKVFVATVDTELWPAGAKEAFKIKRSKIRGVESLGMICAEDELGIGASHEGIMVLDPATPVGKAAKEVLGLEDDYMIEIGLTPNRADAASHLGVARDLHAYLRVHGRKSELKMPAVDEFAVDNHDLVIPVEVEDRDGAPRYAGVTVTGMTAAPSPKWMQNYLRTIGINPKNNIIDITNFILHELGQPLHAFDADKIGGGKIVVKTCSEGTSFTTLDGIERKLSSEDLMICSATEPMCIAGVFGGVGSGVTDQTRNVFIESAYFNPVRIRKSARRHGLNTDASFRFERGIDPNIAIYALKRAALLMKELCGGKISSEIVDEYPSPVEDFRFDISFEWINRVTGKAIPEHTVRGIIAALGITVEKEVDGVLSVAVPPYRVDVKRDVDLLEDILRLYGYNNIEIPEKVNSSLSYAPKPDRSKILNTASDFLSSGGCMEIMSNSLTKASYYENCTSFPIDNCVRIINPLSNDLGVMRQTLLFNALEAVELNVNRRRGDLKLYEAGNCYRYDKSAEGDLLAPYTETMMIGITVTGQEHAASWNAKTQMSDFFTLRAIVEKLLKRFGVDIYALPNEELRTDLYSEGLVLGKLLTMGVVSPGARKTFDIKQNVYFAEINFDALLRAANKNKVRFMELNKYPEVRRDLALLVDSKVTFAELRRVAFDTERKLLRSVSLFDVYEGDKLEKGKKSYALNFVLEDATRTLTDQTIDKVMANLIRQFEAKTGATIR